VQALDESDGLITAVSDAEILHQYRQVSRAEGIFCEPSSATGLAALGKAICEGLIDVKGKTVVTVLTGHGLKDPDTAIKGVATPAMIPPTIDALLEAII